MNYQRVSKETSLSRQPALKSRPSEHSPIVKKPVKKTQKRIKRDFTKHSLVGTVVSIPEKLSKAAKIVMPFGKYKGYQYQDVPTEYIWWALENLEHSTVK
jgi:hypothetical protein